MKRIFALILTMTISLAITSCHKNNISNANNFQSTNQHTEETVTSATEIPKPDQKLSVEGVLDYVSDNYPQYNTFVLVENTVHAMNCSDVATKTALELAREISDVTGCSYEALYINQVEDKKHIAKNVYITRRFDTINIEDSDGIRSPIMQNAVDFFCDTPDYFADIYDSYEVSIRESIPDGVDYIGKNDANIIELMGYLISDHLLSFELLYVNEKSQVLVFPFDYLMKNFSKNNLKIKIWGSDIGEAFTSGTTEDETPEEFVQNILYGSEDSMGEETLYNVFKNYELFYGPQTQEQMRNALEKYKDLVSETVYDEYAKFYDYSVLESVIQTAHSEMEAWWDEYINETAD